MSERVECFWADGTRDLCSVPAPLPSFFKRWRRAPGPPLGTDPTPDDAGPTVHMFERVRLTTERVVYIERDRRP